MGYARARIADTLKAGLYFSGAVGLSRRLGRQSRALILRYHSVASDEGSAPPYIDPGLAVPVGAFERQMRFVRERYSPVSLDQILEALGRRRPLPPRAVAITFDDGYRDNYLYAFPVLKKYGIPAAFYITAGCVDSQHLLWTSRLRYYFMATEERSLRLDGPKPTVLDLSTRHARNASFAYAIASIKSAGKRRGDVLFQEIEAGLKVADLGPLKDAMLSWEEIVEMRRAGMLIGAHTLTHPNLPGLPPEEAEAEIVGSKTLIEARVNGPVLHFAYPNGRGISHFNETVREIVRKAGFLSSVTSLNGPVRPDDDPLALKRMGIYRKHSRIFCLALDMERTRLNGAGA
jgi:peptidoglycan/xylan/chitin deacetylase (PgdA/CDA1 family)